MNFLEFKRRLMTDPHARDPEMSAARRQGEEFADAAHESDQFEASLHDALNVPVPDKLAEDIILRQSMMTETRSHRAWPRYLAVAAALVLAVAVSTFYLVGPDAPEQDLGQHLAWHWEMDGVAALQASQTAPSDAEHIRRIFGQFGVHLDHELLEKVRLSKFCPTPDGAGAHAVLDTDDGPVTLFYMPNTRVPDAPHAVELPDGMESWVFNVEHGSMALVAEIGVDKPALAREIQRQLHFPPGINL